MQADLNNPEATHLSEAQIHTMIYIHVINNVYTIQSATQAPQAEKGDEGHYQPIASCRRWDTALPAVAPQAHSCPYPLRSMVPQADHSTLMHEMFAYLSQDEFASARADRQVELQRHWQLLMPSLPCLASPMP